MKTKSLLTIIMILAHVISYAGNKEELIDFRQSRENAEISKAYVTINTTSTLELLRLYDDGVYERLKYSKDHYTSVHSMYGKYDMQNNKLTIQPPKYKDYNLSYHGVGTHYIGSKSLYSRYIDLMLRNKRVARETTKKEYKQPWFVNPSFGNIVHGINEQSLSIEKVVPFLVKDCSSEKEKVLAIAKFIAHQISYGYGHCGQTETNSILFGREKKAVCAGYSNVFVDMCKTAGIKAKYVSGEARTGFSDILHINHEHAWNVVRIDSVWWALDVTWYDSSGDSWLLKNPNEMVLTHFSANADGRKTSAYVSPDSLAHLPLFHPSSKNRINDLKIFPSTPLVFCENGQFKFSVEGTHKLSSIFTWGEDIINTYYENEHTANTTFTGKKIDYALMSNGSSSTVRIDLKEKINPISIQINNVGEVKYLVVNGTEEDFMRHLINSSSRKHTVRYTNALLAAIKLRDKDAYVKMLGPNVDKAMTYEEIVTSKYISYIDSWDYITWGSSSFDGYETDDGIKITDGVDFTSQEHLLMFTRVNGELVPVEIRRSVFTSFE